MSKTIEEQIKTKIEKQEISMKPKWYFVLGSVLLGVSVVGFLLIGLLFTSVNLYRLRGYELVSFPIELLFINIVFLAISFYLLGKYEFSFKKNISVLSLGFLLLVLLAAFIFDLSGLNQRLAEKKVLKSIYHHRLSKPIPSPEAYFFRRKPGSKRPIHRLVK
jgi:hypothetical protein